MCHGFWAFNEQMVFSDRYFLSTKVDIPKSNNAVRCMVMVHSAVLGPELVLSMFPYACVFVLSNFMYFLGSVTSPIYNLVQLYISRSLQSALLSRRYYTVTGQHADEETIETIIETGNSETFLQKAIQEQGRGQVLETIREIQERHDAVKDIEKNLLELHQIFMDMATLVDTQGEQLNDIESQVGKATSFVQRGTQQLQIAKNTQRNTRKWCCIGIILLVLIILIVVIPILHTMGAIK